MKFKDDKFLIEKVDWVRVSEPERIAETKFTNRRVSFDGKYWYISVGTSVSTPKTLLTGEAIGIDVGIKDLAVCSNGQTFGNINREPKNRKQSKKLRRLQRKVSRKYENNKIRKGVCQNQ